MHIDLQNLEEMMAEKISAFSPLKSHPFDCKIFALSMRQCGWKIYEY
jgi:hypothetical protein